MRSTRWIAGLVFAAALACDGRSVVVLGKNPGAELDAGQAPVDAGDPCVPDEPVNLCATIPAFSGAQAMDGAPGEFCGVPTMRFRVDDAPWKRGSGSFPQVATLRAAWSREGMHMHVHVSDPKIIVAPDDALTQGDAVEFHVAGTSELNGPIDGVRDGGAIQVIVSPPGGGFPARATTYFHPEKGVQTEEPFDPSRFAARIVDDGYEVEIFIPWSNASPGSGSGIGFNIVVDIADVDAATGKQMQAAVGYRFPLETTCTADVGPQPFCDNQTWCTPHLE